MLVRLLLLVSAGGQKVVLHLLVARVVFLLYFLQQLNMGTTILVVGKNYNCNPVRLICCQYSFLPSRDSASEFVPEEQLFKET